jgi:hypothetical protein
MASVPEIERQLSPSGAVIWRDGSVYHHAGYAKEADLEAAILTVKGDLFGPNRIYLDVKRRIGVKGRGTNIPDGYLVDLNGNKPRLYVVENELAVHDLLRHIAVQILQFSLSFESEPRAVMGILLDALQAQPEAKQQCEAYALTHAFRNLDHMLDWLVHESPFAALVIIDQMPDDLENVLAKKFGFGVEVIELSHYENVSSEHLYQFEPFLADVTADIGAALPKVGDGKQNRITLDEIDTVVVPALPAGFDEVFLGENRWHEVRISGTMRPQIKYIAVYRVRPISGITHVAPVRSIEPWKDTGKYVLNMAEPAHEIEPIPLVKTGRVKALQNLRYTSYERLREAKPWTTCGVRSATGPFAFDAY